MFVLLAEYAAEIVNKFPVKNSMPPQYADMICNM